MLLDKYLTQDLKFTIKDNVLVASRQNKERNRNAAQVFLNSLSAHPDFISRIDAETGLKTTFSEIKDRSIQCALWLKKQGISESDVVAVVTHQQPDDFIPFIATLFVNAIYSPWFHKLSEEYARHFFDTCRPKVVFASEQVIDMLARAANKIGIKCQFVVYGVHSLFPSFNDLMQEQVDEDLKSFECSVPKVSEKKLGMIFFSSGSTGTPKATMLNYDCLLHDVPPFNRNNEDTDYWLWYSSLGWISGTLNVAYMIQWRHTQILHAAFDPDETSKVIEKYKVNQIFMSPTMLISSYKAGVFTRYNYESVKMIILIGSKIGKIVLDESMTEAGQCITQQTKSSKISDSVGFICENVKLKVADRATGKALGPNKEGEICFKISTATFGYMNDNETTKKVIDEEAWIHTGDLGYYDESGEIIISDRIKNIINTRTFKVSPSAIENILLGHRGVAKCAVVSVPHPDDIERPFAFIVRDPNMQVAADELIKLAVSRNENYNLDDSLIFVDNLLYTSTGKINHKLLREKANILVNAYKEKLPDFIGIDVIKFIN